jgi:hypothetical protein
MMTILKEKPSNQSSWTESEMRNNHQSNKKTKKTKNTKKKKKKKRWRKNRPEPSY